MNKLRKIGFGIVFCGALSSCGSDNEIKEKNFDESHLTSNWETKLDLTLALDTLQDDMADNKVLKYSSTGSFESLLDQLWKLAFSGDAKVYGVSFLGELDESNPLDPRALHEQLKKVDTVYVENLETGEMDEKILDMTFTQSKVSSIQIMLSVFENSDHEIVIIPTAVGIGKQVFDSETGAYRGVVNKLFISLVHKELNASAFTQQFCVQSDSNGVFIPTGFKVYSESRINLLQDLLVVNGFGVDNLHLSLSMKLDFSQTKMEFKVLSPKEV
jgi:hypothetical protein